MTEVTLIDNPDRRYVPWYRRCIPSWRTVAVATILILAAPFATRWYRLWRMPDVPVPFDVEAFCELPVMEDNAFDYFRKAISQHRSMPDESEFFERNNGRYGDLTWDEVPESIQNWVVLEQPVMDLFRQGGRCADSNFLPPGSNLPLPPPKELREFFRLAYFDGLRLLNEGNTRESAEMLHDSFRASRHLGRRGDLFDRLSGVAGHLHLLPAWHQWSRHPQVTVEDLEKSLIRLQDDWKLTPPVSDQLKDFYIRMTSATKPPMTLLRIEFDNSVNQIKMNWLGLSPREAVGKLNRIVPGWQIPVLWTIGEPELSARAVRLYTAHELKTCDLPFAEQPARLPEPYDLCRMEERTGGLSAEEIRDRVQITFAPIVTGAFGYFSKFHKLIRNEAARQALLETELQLQIRYRRSHAASRADAELLISGFDWPVDPCSAERKPIHFRFADEGLVIWSVGSDGLDQGGQHDKSPCSAGYCGDDPLAGEDAMTDSSPIDKPNREYVPWYRRCIPSWRTVAVATILILAAPFATRWYRLWRMPDVPVPFDVEAFLSFPYPEDDNAYLYFRRAAFLGQGIRHQKELFDSFVQQGKTFTWSDVPPDLQSWVPRGEESLKVFRQGAHCPAGSFHVPLEGYTASATLPSIRLSEVFWLALLESLRQMDAGNPREAAEILHDMFRASRLWGRGGWLNERYHGIYCHQVTAIGWHLWSRHPDVTIQDLEAALERLQEDWKLTLAPSDIQKIDQLMILNEAKLPLTLLRKEWHSDLDRWWQTYVLDEPIKPRLNELEAKFPGWQLPILWVLGEPEIMLRGSKLRLTHDLKTCDLPLAEQPPRTGQPFELSRSNESTAGLTADELHQRLQLSPLLWHLGTSTYQVGQPLWSEAAQQTLLETEIRLQILYRQQGATARNDAERIVEEFRWPVDPCSPTGASLQYRTTDEGLFVWSLGRDLADQQGASEPNQFALDLPILIPWPTGKR